MGLGIGIGGQQFRRDFTVFKWQAAPNGPPFRRVFMARRRLSELTLAGTVARVVLEVARALLERWHNVLRARTGLIRKCLTLVKSGPAVRRVPHEPPSTLPVSPSYVVTSCPPANIIILQREGDALTLPSSNFSPRYFLARLVSIPSLTVPPPFANFPPKIVCLLLPRSPTIPRAVAHPERLRP